MKLCFALSSPTLLKEKCNERILGSWGLVGFKPAAVFVISFAMTESPIFCIALEGLGSGARAVFMHDEDCAAIGKMGGRAALLKPLDVSKSGSKKQPSPMRGLLLQGRLLRAL